MKQLREKIKKLICKYYAHNYYIQKTTDGRLCIQCDRCGKIDSVY